MKQALLFVFTLFVVISCRRDEDPRPHPSLSFEVVVLDVHGDPATILPAGSDPTLAFEVSNTSDNDIPWHAYCDITRHEHLFDTYRVTGDDAGNSSEFFVGSPNRRGTCETSPVLITPGTDYYLQMPWSSNPDNEPLSSGQYVVRFEIEVIIDATYREKQSFEHAFTIE